MHIYIGVYMNTYTYRSHKQNAGTPGPPDAQLAKICERCRRTEPSDDQGPAEAEDADASAGAGES